ncbi:hypothetical protein [Streptomyces sp. NPDC046942]|uniref:hypothetical protein n=1 Tax=Streptomyces sp. NPDC046942 TaxID=3155137 RepID=UPI0033CA977E
MTEEYGRLAVLSDIPAAAARLTAECAYPDIAEWADYHHLHARPTDTEVLAAWGADAGS